MLNAIREAYLREEVSNERARRAEHLRQLEELQRELETKLRDKRNLENRKEEHELTEQMWKKVSAEVEQTKVELEAQPRVEVDQPAHVTKRDNTAVMETLGAGFGGFGLVLLVFGIIFLALRPIP